jgi:hypothetical protein
MNTINGFGRPVGSPEYIAAWDAHSIAAREYVAVRARFKSHQATEAEHAKACEVYEAATVVFDAALNVEQGKVSQ